MERPRKRRCGKARQPMGMVTDGTVGLNAGAITQWLEPAPAGQLSGQRPVRTRMQPFGWGPCLSCEGEESPMPGEHMPFEAFVDRELPHLLHFAFQLTGTSHDAWDLTQDTLV